MRKSLIPVLAATLATSALLAVGTAGTALANPPVFYTGYGAISAAAETAAITNLHENNDICLFPASLKVIYDTKQSSGIWAAEVSEKCQTPNTE
jgi:spermidine/putrescine-binding protein